MYQFRPESNPMKTNESLIMWGTTRSIYCTCLAKTRLARRRFPMIAVSFCNRYIWRTYVVLRSWRVATLLSSPGLSSKKGNITYNFRSHPTFSKKKQNREAISIPFSVTNCKSFWYFKFYNFYYASGYIHTNNYEYRFAKTIYNLEQEE
jgi:hypothetical protein